MTHLNLSYVLSRKFTRTAPQGVAANPLHIYEDFAGQGGAIVCTVSALGNLTEPYANMLAAAPALYAALKWAIGRIPDDGSATYAAAIETLWRAEGRNV